MEIYYWAAPLLVVGSWVASFFGSYLKRKGENLATREDLKHLIEQTAALTQTTKDIEAKISGELWDKQKRWELKRDLLLDTIKALTALDSNLTSLHATFTNYGETDNQRATAANEWSAATERLELARQLAHIVCGDDVRKALHAAEDELGEGGQAILTNNFSNHSERIKQRVLTVRAVSVAIRKELGIEW